MPPPAELCELLIQKVVLGPSLTCGAAAHHAPLLQPRAPCNLGGHWGHRLPRSNHSLGQQVAVLLQVQQPVSSRADLTRSFAGLADLKSAASPYSSFMTPAA